MHAKANEIVEIANQLVHCLYRHQGRCDRTGIDCAGVLIFIAKKLGISEFDTADYTRRPDAKKFRQLMIAAGCRSLPEPEHGCIVRMLSASHPVHTGVYEIDTSGKHWVIHAWAPTLRVVRSRVDEGEDLEIVEAMRFPE